MLNNSIIVSELRRMKELMEIDSKYEKVVEGKKKNQPCFNKKGDFLGWFSRSVSVVTFVFCKNKRGGWCVLASQRGEGTPDSEFVGCWNSVCGYLDFDEDLKTCAQREIKEETGVDIDTDLLKFIKINDDPKSDKRQNLTVHYLAVITDKTTDDFTFSHKDNEKDEVGEIKFIDVNKVDNYKWAFNHGNLIKSYFELFVKDK